MSYTANRGFVYLIFFLFLISPPPSAATPNGELNPFQTDRLSLSGILILVLISLLFAVIYLVCTWYCSDHIVNHNVNDNMNGIVDRWICLTRGLKASVKETFPTMVYSEVKVHKIGRGALECAVCLNEFEDHETVRLIPKCDHVFHTECIDAWLASHTTCPVCRANLAAQKGEPVMSRPAESNNTEIDIEAQIVSNDSEPEEEEERRINSYNADSDVEAQLALEAGGIGLNWNINRSETHGSMPIHTGKPLFPKSHSTGHSIGQPSKNTDQFTLRLPANVRNQFMNRKLNRTTSLILPKECSLLRGYRFIEDGSGSEVGPVKDP